MNWTSSSPGGARAMAAEVGSAVACGVTGEGPDR
jgi:hypothetical protein